MQSYWRDDFESLLLIGYVKMSEAFIGYFMLHTAIWWFEFGSLMLVGYIYMPCDDLSLMPIGNVMSERRTLAFSYCILPLDDFKTLIYCLAPHMCAAIGTVCSTGGGNHMEVKQLTATAWFESLNLVGCLNCLEGIHWLLHAGCDLISPLYHRVLVSFHGVKIPVYRSNTALSVLIDYIVLYCILTFIAYSKNC